MKALVTGLRGTVGQALSARLSALGAEVVGWDRATVPVDRYDAMDRFVGEVAPDVLFHLAVASRPTGRANEDWLVNYEWPSELAWICRQRGVRFVHASTVMVFSNLAKGPFTTASVPDATSGYGYEKRRAEERVFHQNPEAIVARLGWQIGDAPGNNNMLDHLERETLTRGFVDASTRWLPACAFLEDTADALARLWPSPGGLYLLDANEKWTFYEIARAVSALHCGRWKIVASEAFEQDQRMIDSRPAVSSLKTRVSLV